MDSAAVANAAIGDAAASPGLEDQSLLDADKQYFQRQVSRGVPWRGIILALTLFTFGLIFVFFGIMFLSGALELQKLDKLTPYGLLVFGLLCLVPGSYHLLMAIRISFCHPGGISWDDIPNFN